MQIETAVVQTQDRLPGRYRLLALRSLRVSREVKPGQFIHLRVPGLGESCLRRPFSVFKAGDDTLTLLYKCVGVGTQAMAALRSGDSVSLIGPLGNGFPPTRPDTLPVLVAGGYGMAALYLQAARAAQAGLVFVGGASDCDILCVEDFTTLGWEVRVATEDGSAGEQGRVTKILDTWLTREAGDRTPEFFVCGPMGLLKAVGERARIGGWRAWLSLDRHMGCGVGACLACVQKVRLYPPPLEADRLLDPGDGEWKWARVCTEGPVFESRDIIWESHE